MSSERSHSGADSPSILREQIDYYRARAGEYDDWFLRRGRYDRGPELNQVWFDEIEIAVGALEAFAPAGDVLELACGTGLWTQRLAPAAASVTAVDASPEVLEINRKRLESAPFGGRVRYLQSDLFAWRPDRRYDVVFFGFWLSHVPPDRFETFWELVRSALAPDGRVFFVDSLYEPTASAAGQAMVGPEATTSLRRLNHGREFRIVKVFYQPEELEARLAALDWDTRVTATSRYFLIGSGVASGR